jgi:hypothetical protein
MAAERRGRHRIEAPKDNYGRVYIGMLEDERLSMHAKLCYGVMWSFTAEGENGACWAGIDALARRMSCSRPTVWKAQNELRAGGWILLLDGSKGHATNYWRMVVPDINGVNASHQRRLCLAIKDVNTKQEGNQEEKQEGEADASPPPDAQLQKQALDPAPTPRRAPKDPRKEARGLLLAAFVRWWLNQPGHVGLKYPDHPGDKAAAERLLDGGVGAEDMPRLLAAWPGVADDYTKANAFAFRVFCSSFLKIQAAAAKAAPILRACPHPVDRYRVDHSYGDGPDGYDAQEGKCLDCGRSVTRYQGGRVVG